jgi:hypothetical protein
MRYFSLRAGRRTGSAYRAGSHLLVPESFVAEAGWPGGGFVWNWPTGLWVIDGSRTRHVPVVDVTRLATWGLYLLAFVLVIAVGLRSDKNG